MNIIEFEAQKGIRFRVTRDQHARIKAGTLTRELAFQEFVNSGGPERAAKKKAAAEVPISVWKDSQLTLENFSEKVRAATGHARRFRVSSEQKERGLSREEAFTETVSKYRGN